MNHPFEINIIWDHYVIYPYGRYSLDAAQTGKQQIPILNQNGETISYLTINNKNREIETLPILANSCTYNIEVDDGNTNTVTSAGSTIEAGEAESPLGGVKISQLSATDVINDTDLFAISRDEDGDSTFDKTLKVTMADLVRSLYPGLLFKLTLNSPSDGVVKLAPRGNSHYKADDLVSIFIELAEGYDFSGWESNYIGVNNVTDTSHEFAMPQQDIVITPLVSDSSNWFTGSYTSHNSFGAGAWPEGNKLDENGNTFFYFSKNDVNIYSYWIIDNYRSWTLDSSGNLDIDNLELAFLDESGDILDDGSGSSQAYNNNQFQDEIFNGDIGLEGITVHKRFVKIETGPDAGQLFIAHEFTAEHSAVKIQVTNRTTGDYFKSDLYSVQDFQTYPEDGPLFP